MRQPPAGPGRAATRQRSPIRAEYRPASATDHPEPPERPRAPPAADEMNTCERPRSLPVPSDWLRKGFEQVRVGGMGPRPRAWEVSARAAAAVQPGTAGRGISKTPDWGPQRRYWRKDRHPQAQEDLEGRLSPTRKGHLVGAESRIGVSEGPQKSHSPATMEAGIGPQRGWRSSGHARRWHPRRIPRAQRLPSLDRGRPRPGARRMLGWPRCRPHRRREVPGRLPRCPEPSTKVARKALLTPFEMPRPGRRSRTLRVEGSPSRAGRSVWCCYRPGPNRCS